MKQTEKGARCFCLESSLPNVNHMELSLRQLTNDDAPELISWLTCERDLLIWGGPYFDFPLTAHALAQLIAEHDGPCPGRECWALEDENGQFIASFQIAYNYRSGQAGLGRIVIRPTLRGKGIARKLLAIAEQAAFASAAINRLELRVFTFNTPAVAAYKRAGFVVEGTARQSARFGSDYWDAFVMSKLRSERG